MANVVMNVFKYQSGKKTIDMSSDTFNVALINNSFATSSTTEIADVPTFSGISATHEITGVGYVAGGVALGGTTWTEDDVNDKAKFDANDTTWTGGTFTAYGAIVYRAANSLPVCWIDFGGAKTCTNADFNIQWNALGVINLT